MRRDHATKGAILGVVGLTLWLASGCSGTTGHLALATTRASVYDLDPHATTRASDLDAHDFDPHAGRHVVGYSCVRIFVVCPEGMPNFGDAIDDALQQAGAQFLSNVAVRYEIFDIPFVYGVACYVAEGDAG